MSYETRAYDNGDGDPVIVLVATGTHDVSRLVQMLHSGNCEQARLAHHVRAQVRRHNGGRAALQLLAAHGGPDLLFPVGPAEELDQLCVKLNQYGAPGLLTDGHLIPFLGKRKWLLLRSTADERIVSFAVEVSPDRYITVAHDRETNTWAVVR